MSEDKKQSKRPQSGQKRRRRAPGVPTALVVVLLVVALVIGGLGGFAIARKADPTRAELNRAEARNTELENILTAIGYDVEHDKPETWGTDAEDDGLAAIASNADDDDDVSVWDDRGMLQGMLAEDQEPVVVAEFDGGELLSSEFIPVYNDELSTAIFDGYDTEEISSGLVEEVLARQVGEKLRRQDAAKLGLDKLTDAEEAKVKAAAAEEFEDSVRAAWEIVAEDGMNDEQIRAAVVDYLKQSEGITLESLEEEQRENLLENKYRDAVVKDVTVTDEEVKAHYEELLEEQKADFDAVPDDFFYAHLYGSAVVYVPEGFRAVRDIQIAFDDENDGSTAEELMAQLSVMDPNASGENYEAMADQLNGLFAPLETRAQEAVEKLNSGEDFSALMDEYGCSEFLKNEPMRSQGYYINSDSFINSDEYVQGAMMLERPGQVSVPVRSTLGLHLVQYIGDVAPGAIPLEDVQDAVKDDLLEIRRDEYYEDYVNDLLSKANVKYYPERLQ